ncbi:MULTISPECIES: hypothetical protein [unclassified Mucilaginibacter]|nr:MULTISPECIES: hypothetical protein [unclassified Mucilaginibacter]MEB0262813.1 hypothetical protein [Mucilaginibacter sp. 10I4]MEB0278196.1 hypothetical protein [Mucilaginibacter sp. 10B2]MEB0302078.1 hypothetical protein [Mucilaginibacter sp. 5C4]
MKCKALILLFVFLLNTVAGFSCALHMAHQEHNEVKGHHGHQHAIESAVHQHTANKIILSPNDPCCQGAVNNFISQAKQIPASNTTVLIPPFFFISHPIDFFLNPVTDVCLTQLKVTDERRRPPDTDIRVSIQSFLI